MNDDWNILDYFDGDEIVMNNLSLSKDFIRDNLDYFEVYLITDVLNEMIYNEKTIVYTKDNNKYVIDSFDVYDTPMKINFSPFNIFGQMIYNKSEEQI